MITSNGLKDCWLKLDKNSLIKKAKGRKQRSSIRYIDKYLNEQKGYDNLFKFLGCLDVLDTLVPNNNLYEQFEIANA